MSLNPTAGHLPAIVGLNDSIAFGDLPPSQYLVSLSGLAPGCITTGNPSTTVVTAADTARAEFQIHCVPPPVGAIRIVTMTAGPVPDPDGYTVSLRNGQVQYDGPVGVSDSTTFGNLPTGQYTVNLGGLALGCWVDPAAPRSVFVTEADTTRFGIQITCGGLSGTIDVTTTGSGYPPGSPGGYTVTIDGGNAQHIGPNATVRFSFVPIGTHTVALTGVPPWCGVPLLPFPNLGPVLPQSVSVGIATVTRVTFSVFCLG